MSIRLPHAVAVAVACSFIAAPMLAEVTKTKGKKPSSETTSSGETEKKSSPTPTRKKSTSSVKTTPAPDESPEPTPRATSKPTATPTPAPSSAAATTPTPAPRPKYAPNATLQPEDLVEYTQQPERVKTLIADALELTTENLTYTYGSSEPANGGMDCSGTIYYVLRKTGYSDIPRDSSGQYAWTRKAGTFRAVVSRSSDSFEFDELLPGDLLFWTGTYQVDREIPVTHVMIYLGIERKTKKRVMFGASDGRSYAGQPRWGVSVFDFQMPRARPDNPERRGATFIGYGRVPGLRDATQFVATKEPVRPQQKMEEAEAEATPKPKPRNSTGSKKKSTAKPVD